MSYNEVQVQNMDDHWFIVETMDDSTYAISEYKHWEETHCWLVCGEQRAVLIDTGLGVSNIKTAVDELTELPVTVLTTHVHWDHIGGHQYWPFAVHEAEVDWITGGFPLPLSAVKKNLTARPCAFPQSFSIEDYKVYHGAPDRILHDGDRIDLGNRVLTVIHTPGHSPGHCCFYEPDRKYLYTGDLIYCGCLDAYYPTTDLHMFRQSVRRIQALDVERIFPGHHRLPVPVEIIGDISIAFDQLDRDGKLQHGSGIYDYGLFQIHI